MAGKREFVELRYEAAKVGDQRPNWFHTWFHAIITCPMCSGFWLAIPICWIFPVYGILLDVLVVFGANWLVHCLENYLFFSGKIKEKLDEDLNDIDIPEVVSSMSDFVKIMNKPEIFRLLEKKLKNSLDQRNK
jgi:hypothetical protein